MLVQQLSDFTAEHTLLSNQGLTLLGFTSPFCGSCQYALKRLPTFDLPIDQLAWIDSGENGGMVARFEVFHLPTFFLIRDGQLLGVLNSVLEQGAVAEEISRLLLQPAQELP